MVDFFNLGYVFVVSVYNEVEVDWDDYGIDESGLVFEL